MNILALEKSSLTSQRNDVNILKFSELDQETQEIAFSKITALNNSISTDGVTTWSKYTPTIIDRLQEKPNSRNTFFVAQQLEDIIGYVAFYTRKDGVPYPNRYINDSQAYCSWTAVEEEYRGRGLALDLKSQIFNPEHCVEAFRGHIKKTNTSSLRILDKFSERGHITSQVSQNHQILYTVNKKA